MRPFLLLLALLLALPGFGQPTTDTRNLLPVPTSVRWGTATLKPKTTLRPLYQGEPDTTVYAAVVRTLGRSGLNVSVVKNPSANTLPLQINYGKVGRPEQFDEERYSLRVTPTGITIDAPTTLGVLRALATLEQLPQQVGRNVVLPEVDIQDQPRFAWRGLLIDAARHFMPVPVIKRNLSAMAATKLNVLHWHLSDDQGFRVESKTLPRLHEVSGQYYTQEQVREVLRYAAARGIRVIPEFDVPGHTIAWQAAYPQLASGDTAYTVYQSWRTANVALDPTKESTYKLLDTLFGEMTALFPDPYFHVGGDENDGRQWRGSPRIMAFAKSKKMLNANKTLDKHALQTYFNRRVLAILTKYNKQMVGWDEILGPGLPKNAVVQSWRGKKGLYDAAKAGNRTILSNGYYLDLYLPASAAYATDPLPADNPLTAAQQQLVLGGEATMWSEFADSVIVDSRIWPRAAAVAERLWSARELTNAPDMYRRLAAVSQQLEGRGLQHRKAPEQLLRQLAGPTDVASLRTLAQVLEPVKEYKRHFQGFNYVPSTPLNRLVDAAPAESDVAREFKYMVDSLTLYVKSDSYGPIFLVGDSRRNALALRQQLQAWQANHSKLIPRLGSSPTLTEYAPLSAALSAAAALGLERLALLEKQQQPDAEWQAAALKQLDALNKPAGQTELAVLPAIRRLVELK